MKHETGRLNVMAVLAVFAGAQVASAHLPILADGTAVDAEHALVISDIDLSQVVYHEAKTPVQALWFAFDAVARQELYFNPGVPAIERLKDYRPAFALVGPGLPGATLPFDIPAGSGAEVYPTSDIANPEFFYEPFSGTDSWILFEKTVTLPQSGRYYLVGYVPSGQPGKFWIAIGKREEFGLDDVAKLTQNLPRVRAFHESSATTGPCLLIPVGLVGVMFGVRLISRRR
jgi:hypothetical protein